MQPSPAGLWPRVPGYDSEGASDVEDDVQCSDGAGDELEVQRRLQDILAELGDRWVDVPLHAFVPAAGPAKADNSSPSTTRSTPSSKYPRAGPRPAAVRGHGIRGAPSLFRIEGIDAPMIRETLLANGMYPTSKEDWMIQWSGPRISNATFWQLDECQRLNHFPGSTELTNKDRLWANFHHMQEKFGKAAFDFVPESFVLPDELDKFMECYKLNGSLWIVKKATGACGRDMFILRDIRDLPKGNQTWVVSRYISDPLLIQHLKFDLRIYVLVTSYEPLCVYVYREGLARFACREYSVADEHLKDPLRHLTNYSINKYAENFVENQDIHADNYGHKWSFSALNKHLKCTGVDVDVMWSRIMDLIVKTLLAVEPAIRSKAREMGADITGCFELYGFDVLVDAALKPWLLEVNLSPSMSAESPLDWQVKSSLVSDTLNLVGICRGDLQTIRKRRWCLHQLLSRRAAMGLTRGAKARELSNRPTCRKSPFRDCIGGAAMQTPGNGQPFRRRRRRRRRSTAAHPKDEEADAKARAGFERHPVALDTLTVGQLKMLARRLRERRRMHNFLHLHPTRATLARYGLIMDAREPWPSRGEDAFYRGAELSADQLLASILYGPRPCYSADFATIASKSLASCRLVPCLLACDGKSGDALHQPNEEPKTDINCQCTGLHGSECASAFGNLLQPFTKTASELAVASVDQAECASERSGQSAADPWQGWESGPLSELLHVSMEASGEEDIAKHMSPGSKQPRKLSKPLSSRSLPLLGELKLTRRASHQKRPRMLKSSLATAGNLAVSTIAPNKS